MGVTIGQLLEERAEQHPDKLAVAVRHQQKRLTFEQLLEEVSKKYMRTLCIFTVTTFLT